MKFFFASHSLAAHRRRRPVSPSLPAKLLGDFLPAAGLVRVAGVLLQRNAGLDGAICERLTGARPRRSSKRRVGMRLPAPTSTGRARGGRPLALLPFLEVGRSYTQQLAVCLVSLFVSVCRLAPACRHHLSSVHPYRVGVSSPSLAVLLRYISPLATSRSAVRLERVSPKTIHL